MFKSLLSLCLCCFFLVGDVTAIDQFGASPIAPINPTGMPGMPSGPGPGMPGMPGMQPRQRDGRPPASEAVAAAQQEIEMQLNVLLAAINQGIEPNSTDLAPIAATVKKYLPTIQKLDAKGQADLQMLNAWKNYFSGDLKRARVAANAAFRADPKNKDAQTTYIVMSIANNEVKNAKTALTQMRKKPAKSAAAANQQPTYAESPGVLEFDANSLKAELLGEKIGAFEATCLNGTSLPFKGRKALLVLLWKNSDFSTDASSAAAAPAPMPMMMPGMPGMPAMPGMGMQQGQTLTPLQAYGMLFAHEFQNSKVAFLALNLDAEDQSAAVMATLLKNSWPWPQAMAHDPHNTKLASLAAAHAGKPALVVVGPDGEIKYAGALSGFMLRVMAGAAQGSSEATLAMPETAIQKPEEANAPASPAASTTATNEVNAPVAVAPQPTPVPTPKPKAPKSDEEKLNPMATDLYQFALSQKRMAYATGYRPLVDACRRILNEFPDAPEAAKARLLLREIPASKRAQYKITNEEMGL